MAPRFSSILTGRAIVFPSVLIVQIMALARNLVVARLIGPEQFGVAAIFLLVNQFLDLTTDTGLNKFVLSHRYGDRAIVQSSVHFVSLWRGCLLAVAMLLVSYPLLLVLNVHASLGAILLISSLPFILGLQHYDNARLQRQGRFINDSAAQVAGELAAGAAMISVALATRSYLAVLVGLTARAAAQVAISHLLAKRRYQVRLSKIIRPDLQRYSLPLMLNGLVLFLSMQSDRAVVAVSFSPATLGIYAATIQLIMSASTILTKVVGTVYLPALASENRSNSTRGQTYSRLSYIALLLDIALVTSFSALGHWIIPAIYGPKFAISAVSAALIASVQGVRLARVWPSTAALAFGKTKQVLLGNVARLAALPLALGLIALGYGLNGLLVSYALGEFIALLLAVWLLPRVGSGGRGSCFILISVGVVSVGAPTIVAIASYANPMLYVVPLMLISLVAGGILSRLLWSKA